MDMAIIYSWYIANGHLCPPHLFFNFNELIIVFGVVPKCTQPPFVSLYGHLPLVYHKFCYSVLSLYTIDWSTTILGNDEKGRLQLQRLS